jgi:hypothetical protein
VTHAANLTRVVQGFIARQRMHLPNFEVPMKTISIVLLLVLLLSACTAPVPAAQTGSLRGTVTVGPLTPVERVGVPTPIPAPEIFTSRGLNIYKSGSILVFASLNFNTDGTYSIDLPAGAYDVKLKDAGIQFSKGLPAAVTITAGKVTTLDISIDTGIR